MEYCLSEKVTDTLKETDKSLVPAVERTVVEYSVEEVVEQTAIRSILHNVASKPDEVAESVTAESVISSLASGDMALCEEQSTEEENIDDKLELLPEVLDTLIATGAEMETGEADIQKTADLKILEEIFVNLTNKEIDLESACSNDVFDRLQERLNQTKISLVRSRTAKLWLMYLDMITILKQFIKAERVGSWNLHLQSM